MKTIIQASSQHMKHETGIINQQDKHNNQNMKYQNKKSYNHKHPNGHNANVCALDLGHTC